MLLNRGNAGELRTRHAVPRTRRTQGQAAHNFTYSCSGQMAQHGWQKLDAQGHAKAQPQPWCEWTYDPAGELTKLTDELRGQKGYQYDALSRLIRVTGRESEAFGYDAAGNLLGMAPTHEGINAWPAPGDRLMRFATPAGQAQFAYDGHGSRITCTVADKEERYRYDGAHQLTEISHANGARTQYEYDALGRRVAKHITEGGHTQTTLFVWDEDWLVQEVSAKLGAKPVTYIAHPDQAGPLAKLENGATYHYVTDHLGTPQEMHNSEGRIVWAADFSAYGRAHRYLANEIENPIRFAGQYFDAESGLHYNRFRYYDPETGRYVNQDSIGLRGGVNHYAYVKGSPLNAIDPLGLLEQCTTGLDAIDGRKIGPFHREYQCWTR